MRDILDALKKKYEAEVDIAKATIQIYLDKPVGIGEHPQFAEEIDKQLSAITCAVSYTHLTLPTNREV